MKTFTDRVAVVTGGASGIGFAIAESVAALGMRVALADIERSALDSAVESLRAKGRTAAGFVADVADADSMHTLRAAVYDTLGSRVHLLVNNAGVTSPPGTFWQLDLADWQWTIGVNLWGVVHGIETFLADMVAHGEEAHVVNTASVMGLLPGMGIYGITKHAVVALSEALYGQLANANANVAVSVLCPGFVATNLNDSVRNRPASLHVEGRANAVVSPPIDLPPRDYMSADEVARLVVDGIREKRFYIQTHRDFDTIIRARVEAIVERRDPDLGLWRAFQLAQRVGGKPG